ncbi:hypothetical protein COOONC_05355 [Cooperia oncophora]
MAVLSASSNVGKPANPIAAPTTQVRQQTLSSAVSCEPFINATSYIEQMYETWKVTPKMLKAVLLPVRPYQAPPTVYGAVGVSGVTPLIPGVPVGGGFTMPQVIFAFDRAYYRTRYFSAGHL